MADEVGHGGGEVGDIAVFHQLAGGVGDHFGRATGAGPEAGFAINHGLEVNEAEALLAAGQGEEVAGGVFGAQGLVADRAREIHREADVEALDQRFEARPVVALADDAQPRQRKFAAHERHRFDESVHPLVGVGGRQPRDGQDARGGEWRGGDAVVERRGEMRIERVGHNDETLGRQFRKKPEHLPPRVFADAEDAVGAEQRTALEQ